MTDNDIIKVLECCNHIETDCELCPLYTTKECSKIMLDSTLDLINRQKAEIENMNNLVVYNATCATKLQLKLVEAKAEAVKEFLRKQEIELANNTDISAVGYQSVIELNIKILKEMGIE